MSNGGSFSQPLITPAGNMERLRNGYIPWFDPQQYICSGQFVLIAVELVFAGLL